MIANINVKTTSALIVEGSAMRSVFSAGLLDGFIGSNFDPFDFYIGVSAGAYNLASYLNHAPATSLRIFEQFATNKNFINFWRFLRGGHLIDLDWLERYAFDSQLIDPYAVCRSGKPFYVGLTDVATGEPVYMQATPENIQSVIKASTALPWFYRNFPQIDGRLMTDGGVSDGIPVVEALRLGATKIMVVRARHKHYMKKDTLFHKCMRRKMQHYPQLYETLSRRVMIHQNTIAQLRNPPPGVSIVEICPPEHFTLGRFSRQRHRLREGYQLGVEASSEAIAQWMKDTDKMG